MPTPAERLRAQRKKGGASERTSRSSSAGGATPAERLRAQRTGQKNRSAGRKGFGRAFDVVGGAVGAIGRNAGGALLGAAKVLDVPRQLVDKTPVGDLADKLRDDNPKGVLGFLRNVAVDVVEDPLTYVTFGTSAAAKAGLKTVANEVGKEAAKDVAARGARKVLTAADRTAVRAAMAGAEGGSEKAAARVLRKLDRGGQGGIKVAGRTVVSGQTLRPITAPVARAGRAVAATPPLRAITPRGELAASHGREVADAIGAAGARAARATDEELRQVVLPALDVGGDVASVPARLRPLADHLAQVRETFTARQLEEAILPGARDTAEYVPRRLTDAGRKALKAEPALAERFGVVPDELKATLRQGGHIKARTMLPDAPIAEVERVVGDQLRAGGTLRGKLLEDNPVVLFGTRAARAEKAVAEKRFLDEVTTVSDDAGESVLRRADDGVQRPDGWETVDAGPAGTFYAPAEVAAEVARVRDVVTNDDALREFQGLLGRLNTLWKGYATVPLVGGAGFHLRNAQGNVWNNFLAGVTNPRDYSRALRIQRGARRGDAALSTADRHVLDLARKHGVIDAGFFLSELTGPGSKGGRLARAAKGKRLSGGRLNPLSLDNPVITGGRAVGSAVENNARLAHFIAKLKHLGSAEEAAASVRRYLFDYADLTPTERNLKKVVAFWTFMRKNTPLQVAELARQPGKFSGLAHTYNQAASTKDIDALAEAAPWAPRQGLLPFRVGGQDVALGLDLPSGAAADMASLAPEDLLGRLGGVLPSGAKALAEAATGRSLFTGAPVRGSGAERGVEALFPLYGKVKRAPYTAKLTDDPQALARLISALTGLSARRLEDGDYERDPYDQLPLIGRRR